MDYEVFMLSRIQEHYLQTGEIRGSIATGLERIGRLISGAAAIMVGVFLVFGALAHTIIIKEIGIGLTVAVAIDATVVRILLVPAVMRVLGRAGWWAPKPLHRLHQRLGLGEAGKAASITVVRLDGQGSATSAGPTIHHKEDLGYETGASDPPAGASHRADGRFPNGGRRGLQSDPDSIRALR